ncbi:MAG: hypothetical protein H6574_03205 [Lewinellaceae bacterium]|nr:hypothetical protein [Lewinellaceae bacterium]
MATRLERQTYSMVRSTGQAATGSSPELDAAGISLDAQFGKGDIKAIKAISQSIALQISSGFVVKMFPEWA